MRKGTSVCVCARAGQQSSASTHTRTHARRDVCACTHTTDARTEVERAKEKQRGVVRAWETPLYRHDTSTLCSDDNNYCRRGRRLLWEWLVSRNETEKRERDVNGGKGRKEEREREGRESTVKATHCILNSLAVREEEGLMAEIPNPHHNRCHLLIHLQSLLPELQFILTKLTDQCPSVESLPKGISLSVTFSILVCMRAVE